MPEEKEPPRPHGDKLKDLVGGGRKDPEDSTDGAPVSDEDDGELRKRQYKNGADLVSEMD